MRSCLFQVVRTLFWKAWRWIHWFPSWSGAPSPTAPSGSTGRPCTSSAKSSVRSCLRTFSTSSAKSTSSAQFSQTTCRWGNKMSSVNLLSHCYTFGHFLLRGSSNGFFCTGWLVKWTKHTHTHTHSEVFWVKSKEVTQSPDQICSVICLPNYLDFLPCG